MDKFEVGDIVEDLFFEKCRTPVPEYAKDYYRTGGIYRIVGKVMENGYYIVPIDNICGSISGRWLFNGHELKKHITPVNEELFEI